MLAVVTTCSRHPITQVVANKAASGARMTSPRAPIGTISPHRRPWSPLQTPTSDLTGPGEPPRESVTLDLLPLNLVLIADKGVRKVASGPAVA